MFREYQLGYYWYYTFVIEEAVYGKKCNETKAWKLKSNIAPMLFRNSLCHDHSCIYDDLCVITFTLYRKMQDSNWPKIITITVLNQTIAIQNSWTDYWLVVWIFNLRKSMKKWLFPLREKSGKRRFYVIWLYYAYFLEKLNLLSI